MSENTMIYACYRMGYLGKQTVHGFRGLGSTGANEAECFKPDWVEMALAHADEDEVRGAYTVHAILRRAGGCFSNGRTSSSGNRSPPDRPFSHGDVPAPCLRWRAPVTPRRRAASGRSPAVLTARRFDARSPETTLRLSADCSQAQSAQAPVNRHQGTPGSSMPERIVSACCRASNENSGKGASDWPKTSRNIATANMGLTIDIAKSCGSPSRISPRA